MAPATAAPSSMGTGIFCFDLGTLSHIYDAFLADKTAGFATFGNEQELAEHYLTSWKAWDFEWVICYKLQLRRPILIDLFHRSHSSMRELPHFWRGPVKWVRKYWVDNGYQGD